MSDITVEAVTPIVSIQTVESSVSIDVVGGVGSNGLDQATADSLYVNTTGDTMTGDLTLNASAASTVSSIKFTVDGNPAWKIDRSDIFGDDIFDIGSDINGAHITITNNLTTDPPINAFGGLGVYGGLWMSNYRIMDVADPVDSKDVATKQYVDNNSANVGTYRLGQSDTTGMAAINATNLRHWVQKITVTKTSILLAVELYMTNTVSSGSPGSFMPVLCENTPSNKPGRILSFTTNPVNNAYHAVQGTDFSATGWVSMPINCELVPGDYWIGFMFTDQGDLGVVCKTGPADSSYYWTASGAWLSPPYIAIPQGSSTNLWAIRGLLL